ncbi:MAG: TetR/AcrR family transcriptional regulator [Gordonia sp. (in: high G+C Gram-positive bacteria)]|uniref:TetR/AcrR family transcriptional regulator n=1 Tax=Gordonia sp. (in: high G+C Gram-positive bacteria) TaxID=84139 RepID=UPI003C75FDAF
MAEGTWARARHSRERREHETRTAVIDAAAVVFAESGYAKASMGAIAEAAAVARPTVYLYFADKADIFGAVAEQVRDQFLRAHEVEVPSADPRELWRASTAAFLEAYRENGALLTVIEHQALVDEGIRRLWTEIQDRPKRRMVKFVVALSDAGTARPAVPPEVLGDAVIGMLAHFATLLEPEEDVAQRVDQLTAMHMRLLGLD